MRLILSHRIERLADQLMADVTQGGGHPLSRKVVVVPSKEMKGYLQVRWAETQQIFWGVRILTLSEAWTKFLNRDGKVIPSSLELSLELERQIIQHQEREELRPLFEVLKERKHYPKICDELGQIFLQYGMFGEEFLSDWEKQEGWQQFLWRQVFSPEGRYTYFCREIQEEISEERHLSLFGVSYLPRHALAYFKRAAADCYLFSPCAEFWEDLSSDRERIRLEKGLEKRKISPEQIQELSFYLKQTNPLLANWGRMNRAFLAFLDDIEEREEDYTHEEASLLSCLQGDLLVMRSPADSEKRTWDPQDQSVQVHAATSRLREVEVLFENLCALGIEPKQISVFAPNICLYAPYIHMVFGGENPVFDYQMTDLEERFNDRFIQAVQDLLLLPKKRFSVSSVLKLFSYDFFLQKWGFAEENKGEIREWLERVGVSWGLDQEQRAHFLSSLNPRAAPQEGGTWEHGLARLAWGLIMVEEERFGWAEEGADPETLGKLFHLLSSLKRDLLFLCDERERKLGEWFSLFEGLLQSYFAGAEEEPFFIEFFQLRKSFSSLLETSYPFTSVERIFSCLFKRKTAVFQKGNLQAIRFGSLHTGVALPSQVICLLGMEEEGFPREKKWGALCALKEGKHNPSQGDEDRALFLELVHAARSHLIISYQQTNADDGKEQSPSLPVQELLSYLDRAYTPAPSSLLCKIHSPLPQFLIGESDQSLRIIDSEKQSPSVSEGDLVIPIKRLSLLARHPVQFYLNYALGIYIDKEERDPTHREFILSPLERGQIRKAALYQDFASVLSAAQKLGKLPQGIFHNIAEQKLQTESEEFYQRLMQLGVDRSEIFSVELSSACVSAHAFSPKRFLLPPLTISLSETRKAHFVGLISDLSPQGLLFHGEEELKDLLKIWPLYLIFLNLSIEEVPAAKQLLLTKSGEIWTQPLSDPLELLIQYVHYYESALKEMSLLMPQWSSSILKGTPVSNGFTFEPDPYLAWLEARQEVSLLPASWAEKMRGLLPEGVWNA